MYHYLHICRYLDYKSYLNFKIASLFLYNNKLKLFENKNRRNNNLYYTSDELELNIKIEYIESLYYFLKLNKPVYIYIKKAYIDLDNNIICSKNKTDIAFFNKLNILLVHNFDKRYYNFKKNIIFKHNKLYVNIENCQNDTTNYYQKKDVLIKFIGCRLNNYNKITAKFNLIKIFN